MQFELLNIQSIRTKYMHRIYSTSSWTDVTGHADYPRLRADAAKFDRREDLDDLYMLFMHDGETILCSVKFTPNMKHQYTGKEVFNSPQSRTRSKRTRSASARLRGRSRSGRPSHLRTGSEAYQNIAYIDFLSCDKDTPAYRALTFRPASHLLLHRLTELLTSIEIPFVYLTVLAQEPRPSALYQFYEAMGFVCYPFTIGEYRAGYPYRFARLSNAKRRESIERMRTKHRRKQSNNAMNLTMSCGYMVVETSDLLEKLTASVNRAAA